MTGGMTGTLSSLLSLLALPVSLTLPFPLFSYLVGLSRGTAFRTRCEHETLALGRALITPPLPPSLHPLQRRHLPPSLSLCAVYPLTQAPPDRPLCASFPLSQNCSLKQTISVSRSVCLCVSLSAALLAALSFWSRNPSCVPSCGSTRVTLMIRQQAGRHTLWDSPHCHSALAIGRSPHASHTQ